MVLNCFSPVVWAKASLSLLLSAGWKFSALADFGTVTELLEVTQHGKFLMNIGDFGVAACSTQLYTYEPGWKTSVNTTEEAPLVSCQTSRWSKEESTILIVCQSFQRAVWRLLCDCSHHSSKLSYVYDQYCKPQTVRMLHLSKTVDKFQNICKSCPA